MQGLFAYNARVLLNWPQPIDKLSFPTQSRPLPNGPQIAVNQHQGGSSRSGSLGSSFLFGSCTSLAHHLQFLSLSLK